MDNPNLMYMEKETSAFRSINKDKRIDKNMLDQIEYLIQQQFQVFSPALVFEYKPTNKEFGGWDYDDLYEFFSHFGEIDTLEINARVALILFKTFMDAYTTREFLMNTENFKEQEKNNFNVRWYTNEDEVHLTDIMRMKMKKNTPSSVIENVMKNGNSRMDNSYYGFYNFNVPNENNLANFNGQYNYYSQWNMNPSAKNEFSNVLSTSSTSQNFKTSSSYYDGYEDSQSINSEKCLVNGKYTCRFNIQIENDNEFQVARRLIGAKVNKF
jgi:hypothetical protein